ncbi:MAG: TetR/AcrR family transcriptional regulator [Thermoflexaceae bacterium]|nr:TetR/AcrR family transcriptional regulator [Thermoflexaceae bacterium]
MAQPARNRGRIGSGATTRARIIGAATDLFARDGYEGTTVRAIAARCHITDPALYYHFRSKREILDAIWRNAPAEVVPVEHESSLSREGLVNDIEERFYAWTRSVALLRVLLGQVLRGDERATDFRRDLLERFRAGRLPSAQEIYGARGEIVLETVFQAVSGVLYDTVFQHGDTFQEVVNQDSFRRRLRRIIDQALPCPPFANER